MIYMNLNMEYFSIFPDLSALFARQDNPQYQNLHTQPRS